MLYTIAIPDLTKMSDFDIEDELHPLIMKQFASRAVRHGLMEKELATRSDISDIHFSRIKHGDRHLPVRLARKLMTKLNYRAVQIDRVEEVLKFFHSTRKRRKAMHECGGLNKLQTVLNIIEDQKNRGVILRIFSNKNNTRYVDVIIDCKGDNVIYTFTDKKSGEEETLDGQEAAQRLLPRTKNAVAIFLARILTTLQFEWYKALMADLDQLDSEKETIRKLARMATAKGKDEYSLLWDAQQIFQEHVGIA